MDKDGWRKILDYLIENANDIYEDILCLEKHMNSYNYNYRFSKII